MMLFVYLLKKSMCGNPKLCWYMIREDDSKSVNFRSDAWLNPDTKIKTQAAMMYQPEE